LNVPETRRRDARWRASVWREVDRFQHEQDDGPHLATGTATSRAARRPRLRIVGQPVKRTST